MQWFNHLKFGPRLILTFAALVVMMVLQAVIAWNGMARIDSAANELANTNMSNMQSLGELRADLSQYRNYVYQSLVRASAEVKEDGTQNAAARREKIEQTIAQYRSRIAGAESAKQFDQFVAQWEKARESYDLVAELVSVDLPDDAIDTFVSETRELHTEATTTLEAIASQENALADAARQSASETYTASLWGLVLALLAGTVAGSVMVTLFVRSITSRLRMAVGVANDVADGRLDGRIDVMGKDEISDLLRAMSRMQSDLSARIEKDAAIAHENLRIRTALESSTTGVYVTDAKARIVFANPALRNLLADNADIFRHALPKLSSSMELVGTHANSLETTGDVDMALLERLQRDGRVDRTVEYVGADGQKVTVFQIMAGIRDSQGALIGYIIEWRNRTADVQTEQEISRIIDLAARGQLSERIDTTGKQGFHLLVADNLNRLLDANAAVLGKLSSLLNALSEGDLRVRMEGHFEGVFAQMRDDANTMADQLSDIVSRIQQAAAHITSASGEIATGNQDLSRRTEQQAANLEETAASMEELTSTVRQNAEHARQANQLAVGAADVAARGGQVTQAMVTTMGQIEQASRKIADIISVIDGIAFQTNILALNAAVEAARAGEQGRGFAVVAAEVRTLAQRSAAAAKEIKHLIDDSVNKVSEGSSLVSEAGSTMKDIVSSVQRVTDIMAEISAASQEQSAGIEQVSQTVTQMDETTQQNAALVEEATAAARSMEEQAQELTQIVSTFRLAGNATAPAAVDPPAVSAANLLHRTLTQVEKQTTSTAAASAKPEKPSRRHASKDVSSSTSDNEWQEF